ncbi:MAG: hypothetical protein HYY60_02205 [Parcubacteria group bacterium]|nr:hypothetical protein [Parcubacteria group bacterium]MBI3074815.1 hypothetical protein [Parcubacteria group bacterium]
MDITKVSGEHEPFHRDKFCGSLKAAGAPDELVEETCKIVTEKLAPGATTTELWRRALRYLAKKNRAVAARYNLRHALLGLGPAGFLFEQYLEVLLKTLGYETKRNQIMEGKCVSHEVDVIAEKDGECFLIEAKYHNQQGIKVATDVVMYADARREDISRAGKPCKMWVFTNTKFTGNALRYGACRDLRMTGWRYPEEGGLEALIVEHALYPITTLLSVDRFAREQFAKHGMLLAQDIAPYTKETLEEKLGIPMKRGEKIIEESREVVYGTSAS